MKPYEKISEHIYRQHRKYRVVQNNTLYGSFGTLKEAVECHERLIREGVIKKKHRGRPFSRKSDRYISRSRNGNYRIQKSVHGVKGHYGTFKTIEEAREERDYLESIEWDYDNME